MFLSILKLVNKLKTTLYRYINIYVMSVVEIIIIGLLLLARFRSYANLNEVLTDY